MKKRKNSSDNRLLPSIRRNEISRSSLNSYKGNKSNNNMNISRINSLFSSLCYFINENSVEEKIKREEEILYSPLVKSIKKSKILLSKSFNFDDHYSDTLD